MRPGHSEYIIYNYMSLIKNLSIGCQDRIIRINLVATAIYKESIIK